MNVTDIYDEIKNKKSEYHNLYKKPIKEKGVEIAKIQVFKPNTIHQADILFITTDAEDDEDDEETEKSKILVIVDLHTKLADAEPIGNIANEEKEVYNALIKIYNRHILEYPKILSFDNGNEFKANKDLKDYLDQIKVSYFFTKPHRHRQNGQVEIKNKQIGTLIHKTQGYKELISGEENTEWIKDLPKIIELINKNAKPPITTEESQDILATKLTADILPIGTEVRVMLDAPKSLVKGNLSGKFRDSDSRWEIDKKKITNIQFRPGYPVLYTIDNDLNVSYGVKQLQVVKKNEKAILDESEMVVGKTYRIENIIDKKIENRKLYYKVHWKYRNAKDDSWEPVATLNSTADLIRMKKAFENK